MLTFKQFIREYHEGKYSTFSSNGKSYQLDIIFDTTENIPVKPIEISKFNYLLNDVPKYDLKRAKMDFININIPILITKEENLLILVDGFHRLIKAHTENKKTILSKLVPKYIMDKARIK